MEKSKQRIFRAISTADPWIHRFIQSSIRMYGTTIEQGGNAVPKLAFGTRWVVPEPNDADDLEEFRGTASPCPTPDPAASAQATVVNASLRRRASKLP